jgi:hypothetical protein
MFHKLAPQNEGNRRQDTSRRYQTNTNYFDSSINVFYAESTMRGYSDTPPPFDAQLHHQTFPAPSDSTIPFRGEFPPDFRGCLGCGGPEQVFRSCPLKEDRETIDRFHRNFNAKFG